MSAYAGHIISVRFAFGKAGFETFLTRWGKLAAQDLGSSCLEKSLETLLEEYCH